MTITVIAEKKNHNIVFNSGSSSSLPGGSSVASTVISPFSIASTGTWTLGPSSGTVHHTTTANATSWSYTLALASRELVVVDVDSTGSIYRLDDGARPSEEIISALTEWAVYNQGHSPGAQWFVKNAI